MSKAIEWLTYADLDAVLKEVGYTREDYPEERIYRHPSESDAFIVFPPLSWDAPVREYHRVAARQIADGFGIMDASAFELLLLRKAHKEMAALLSATT